MASPTIEKTQDRVTSGLNLADYFEGLWQRSVSFRCMSSRKILMIGNQAVSAQSHAASSNTRQDNLRL